MYCSKIDHQSTNSSHFYTPSLLLAISSISLCDPSILLAYLCFCYFPVYIFLGFIHLYLLWAESCSPSFHELYSSLFFSKKLGWNFFRTWVLADVTKSNLLNHIEIGRSPLVERTYVTQNIFINTRVVLLIATKYLTVRRDLEADATFPISSVSLPKGRFLFF